MAKSILRALVGDYKLPDLSSVHEKWNHISTKYGHNLWLALNSIAPKQEIAKDALLNIMRSLDIPIDA